MTNPIWRPSKSVIEHSNLYKYENFLKENFGFANKKNYQKIWEWSVTNSEKFWESIWEFTKIKGLKGKEILKKSDIFYKNKFFPDSKLNFTENLLIKNENSTAIIFKSENGFKCKISWADLNKKVFLVANWMKSNGIKKGDRIAAYMSNAPETVIFFLASASLGAIWSSCSPDFGAKGAIDRFSQIDPKLLIITEKYYYNGKEINIIDRSEEIINQIPSIKKIIVVPYPGTDFYKKKKLKIKNIIYWDQIILEKNNYIHNFELNFFNDPLAILYSSGTTGKPKCICHTIGGVLLQHKKEHQLHCNIKNGDIVFYFTTCGWMMWNWLITALASGASIVLFDGFPMYKKADLLFELAEEENISLFGISAKYIETLKKNNINIKSKYDLNSLRTICSTGSPLSPEGFKYIYENIKNDVHLSSISGGTDIVSCFILGNLFQPVFEGEIQNKGLGMDVDIFNDQGVSIKNLKGELVCKKPFPCMPLKFWNDNDYKKYHSAYFTRYKNIWHHGDFGKVTSNNGFIIYGRSDATLNPGGVRLGTAEIYNILEKFVEIKESLVIGQTWNNDVRIVLFVILSQNFKLNEKLKEKISQSIRRDASPRHVPSKIIAVKDIPRTKNGKITELTVKKIVEGENILNMESILNPEILEEYKNIKELNE